MTKRVRFLAGQRRPRAPGPKVTKTAAKLIATVVLPTPPFWLSTPIILGIDRVLTYDFTIVRFCDQTVNRKNACTLLRLSDCDGLARSRLSASLQFTTGLFTIYMKNAYTLLRLTNATVWRRDCFCEPTILRRGAFTIYMKNAYVLLRRYDCDGLRSSLLLQAYDFTTESFHDLHEKRLYAFTILRL